jgi:hypothetical protein
MKTMSLAESRRFRRRIESTRKRLIEFLIRSGISADCSEAEVDGQVVVRNAAGDEIEVDAKALVILATIDDRKRFV